MNTSNITTNSLSMAALSISDAPAITTQTPRPPLASFHLFPTLPEELRLQIWGFATPPPRLVTNKSYDALCPILLRSVPAVLHACRESREDFLSTEGMRKDHPTYTLVSGRVNDRFEACYVSMEQDVVVADSPALDNFPAEFKDIRRICVTDIDGAYFAGRVSSRFVARKRAIAFLVAYSLPKLEELYIIDFTMYRDSEKQRNEWYHDIEIVSVPRALELAPDRKTPRITYLTSPRVNNRNQKWAHIDSGVFEVKDIEEMEIQWEKAEPSKQQALQAAAAAGKKMRWATLV